MFKSEEAPATQRCPPLSDEMHLAISVASYLSILSLRTYTEYPHFPFFDCAYRMQQSCSCGS